MMTKTFAGTFSPEDIVGRNRLPAGRSLFADRQIKAEEERMDSQERARRRASEGRMVESFKPEYKDEDEGAGRWDEDATWG